MHPRYTAITALALSLVGAGTSSAAPFCTTEPGGAPPLAQHLERDLGAPPVANLGPLAETLADELLQRLCATHRVAETLVSTCGAGQLVSLQALQARLAADLLNTAATALQGQLDSLPQEQQLAVALLAGLSGGLEPSEVAHRVAFRLGLTGAECAPPLAPADDPAALAVHLVWQLTQDTSRAALRVRAESTALVEASLSQARGSGALTPAELVLVTRLAEQNEVTLAWWQKWRATPSDTQALHQLLRAEFTLYQRALSLTAAREVTLPGEAWATLDALLNRDLDAAVAILRQWLQSRSQLRGEVLDAAATVLRFSRAATQQEAERIVRGQVLGLGPWSEKVLFAASGGVPQLASDNFNVVGEALLGYNDDAWGVVGGGGVSVLEFESNEYFATTAKLSANGDAWFNLQLGERTKLDFRGTFDVTIFEGETTLVDADATLNGEETSALIRGGGLLGVRYQQPLLGLGAWAGGGAQLESHSQRGTVAADNDVTTALDDSDSVSGIVQARLRSQWEFAPELLALRASVDWKIYSMARLTSAINSGAAGTLLVETDESATQLEAIGRAFIDIEAARVLDFVPGAGVGIDHYQLAVRGQPTRVVTIPIYMLGVRRSVF
ncbi:MAG: hypothetical protein RJA70_3325 [Pseudomonadota bacterium]|jgi:hypothetical protein